jgi:RNA polymerase sigma-70 factor (ECF subfamily)
MVAFRLDSRLRRRIDAADVVQEAFLEASANPPEFFRQQQSAGADTGGQSIELFLWLRGVVNNKLLELHRHHLGTKMRDAGRELAQRVAKAADADHTTRALVNQLTAGVTGPGTRVERREVARRVREALDTMEPIDREVLALRHFEQLTNGETARVLNIRESAATKRHLRALRRLKEVLGGMPGGLTALDSL